MRITRAGARRAAMLAATLVGLGGAVDALLVEPRWIEVIRSTERMPMLRAPGPDLTLVHLSDLHISTLGDRERRAIGIVNESRPDIIVISGDLVRGSGHPDALESFLSSLQARYGRYVVWGNHDYRDRIPDGWGPEVVARSGFTLLRNTSQAIGTPAGRIVVAGVDDPVTGRDNMRLALATVPRRDACILVAHSAEITRNLGNWDIDLVLAGHTHGGQIRLPWFGALVVPYGDRDHLDGWFDVPPGVRLHVSRGLGWSILPIRFLCRPAIDIITLRPGPRPDGRTRASVGQS